MSEKTPPPKIFIQGLSGELDEPKDVFELDSHSDTSDEKANNDLNQKNNSPSEPLNINKNKRLLLFSARKSSSMENIMRRKDQLQQNS